MNNALRDHLVEQACIRFSIQTKLQQNLIKTPTWSPDIVISRDPGSGGRVIAKKIADKLNWKLLDKHILRELAQELHIPEKEFAKIDEHSRNWLADTFNLIFNPNYVSDMLYLKHLKSLLMKHAREGEVVIVGRGANHIIPADKCLRVRITAPFSTRVRNTMHHENKTNEEASRWVRYVENKRNCFIKQYFGKDPYAPEDFDLVVNTEHLNLNQGRDLIIGAFLAKFPTERRRLKDKL